MDYLAGRKTSWDSAWSATPTQYGLGRSRPSNSLLGSSEKHLPDKVEYPWLRGVGTSEDRGKCRRIHQPVRFQILPRQTCVCTKNHHRSRKTNRYRYKLSQ